MSYGGIGHPWARGIRLQLVATIDSSFVVLLISALMPSVELARNFPRELLQIEGVFRLEGLFTFAQEVETFRGLLEEKRIDHGTVEVGARRRRMALVGLV